ncbi:MAG: hypothetical protein LBL98_06315 [Ruminococcus sp.]|jgi:hypothetical protein|nr:hypothetical protein [Ruminococcus sp.]
MENQTKEKLINVETAEELVLLSKAAGDEISLDTAEKIIAAKNKSKAELSDSELDSVTGGGLRDFDGNLIIASPNNYSCDAFNPPFPTTIKRCFYCKNLRVEKTFYDYCILSHVPNFRNWSYELSSTYA